MLNPVSYEMGIPQARVLRGREDVGHDPIHSLRKLSFGLLALLTPAGEARSTPYPPQVTERVSVGANGVQGNATVYSSYYGRPVSSDGRWVVFASSATNLVANDINPSADVFVRDRLVGSTVLVSVSSTGMQGDNWSGLGHMGISADGNFVAFDSAATNLVTADTNGTTDVFVHDRLTGVTERVSLSTFGLQPDLPANGPSLSADGRFVAFESYATNLVGGDGNNLYDCFVRDRGTGVTERVSVSTSGAEGNGESRNPVISADGSCVVFSSTASNLVAGDTNGVQDTFVHDRQAGTTIRVSVDSNGVQGSGSSSAGIMSDDGRFIAFRSDASNLVPGDTNACTDAFVRDLINGLTERVSVSTTGAQGDAASSTFCISGDGRFVSLSSLASNLAAGDTYGLPDVFIRDRLLGTTERVSVATDSSQANGATGGGWMTPDGRYVVMSSLASNLVPGDTNAVRDTFLRDRFASGFTSICDPGASGVIACPCNNAPSGAARGCDNSSFTGGAALSASGIAYLSMDSLVFHTSDERPSVTSILLQGDTLVPAGAVFGQGVRCVGGLLKRMYVKTSAGGSITAPDLPAGDPTISVRSAYLGVPIQAGQPYLYCVYYRDPVVLGGCPALSTFNVTQTGSVTYWP